MIVARWDAADTVAAGRTDSVVTAANANLQAAVEVTLTGVTATYKTSTDFDVLTGDYVMVGTELYLESASASDKLITVDVDGAGAANIGGDNYNVAGNGTSTNSKASYTLGEDDVEFALAI